MAKLNIIVIEIPLEELNQPSGNLAFQKDEDYVNQAFKSADYLRIKGEVRIYHKSEFSELIRHINELKK